ncbi:MAG: deoxyhypusine synthase family protein [Candidatus Heimdallarchaeota archaeon]
MQDNQVKESYLIKKIVPFQAYKVKNVDDLLSNLSDCGFQGRNLAEALDIFEKMVLDKDCTKVMTLSGAMVPAGMGDLICALMEHKIIDVLVTTGANIIHDLVDAITNIGHYVGNSNVNDDKLFEFRINRIYDVFLPEHNYYAVEKELLSIIKNNFTEKNIFITPSEFLRKLGENIERRSIISIAAKNKVPIFVPAFSDSELALDLIKYVLKEEYSFIFDILKDVQNFGEIIKNSKICGTLIIGGGVPRNWAQQIFPLLDQIESIHKMGYDYSVRIHTAMEYDGGLSGSTFSEAKSWGKYSLESKHVSVWCDATIALPLLVCGLLQRLKIHKTSE